jgi:hypothetical protein
MRRPHHLVVLLALGTGAALPIATAKAEPAAAAALPSRATPLTVTNGNEGESGTFQHLNQVHWYKVALKKGQDYSLWGYHDGDAYYGGPTVTVYAPDGRQLKTFDIGAVDFPSGIEFRAPAAGTYYLEVVATGEADQPFPVSYLIGAAFDCRGGPTTRCTLSVGQKAKGFYNFYLDNDWRKITAQAGKRYSLQIGAPGGLAAAAEVRDRNGTVLGRCATNAPLGPCSSFKATYSGPYYVNLSYPDEESGPYQVGLTSP